MSIPKNKDDILNTAAIDPTAVLSSPDFKPVPYRDRHASLADKLGLDFTDILFAFDYIPLALSGDEHRARRASLARVLKERQEVVEPEIPAMVDKHFSALAKPGHVDILNTCVEPFAGELLSRLTGAPADLDLSIVSRIFSHNLGISRRRQMQQQLHNARAALEDLFPDDEDVAIGERLALLVLGRDALIGTLSRSLHNTLEDAQGKPLRDCEPAPHPTRTGVPFIDRQAVRATEISGRSFEEGEVVRCHLQTLEQKADPDYVRFFGKGIHVCLGRAISLIAFAELARYLSDLPVRVTDIEFVHRKDDVFLYPERFTGVVKNGS